MKGKEIITMILALLVVFGTTEAQKKIDKKKVPKVVYSAFGEQYPDAVVQKWEMPDCDCYEDWINQWEAQMSEKYPQDYSSPNSFYVTYKYQDKEQKSIYYRNGEWMQTQTKLKKKSIPASIMAAVNQSEYSDWDVADYAILVEKPSGNGQKEAFYKVFLKGGLKRHILKVNTDGSIIPKEKLFEEE